MKRQLTALLLLGMFLGSYKGYVALWEDGAKEPRQIFPYQVTSLPLADQDALEKGIRIRNSEELTQRIEDFLS